MRRRITLLGLLAGLALAGVGCADYVGDDLRAGDYPRHDLLTFEEVAAEADALDQPREPVPTDPRELDVGDCFDDLAAPPVRGFEWARQVDLVPCRLPHRYELFARVPLTDGEGEPWPGASVAEEVADRRCLDAFEEFVDTEWSSSELDYAALAPDRARWEAGDTGASCALFDLGLAPLEGSAEGSGR